MIDYNAVVDLIAHQEETGLLLLLNEFHIAALEEQGYIVDLVSGEVSRGPDFVNSAELAEEMVQNGS